MWVWNLGERAERRWRCRIYSPRGGEWSYWKRWTHYMEKERDRKGRRKKKKNGDRICWLIGVFQRKWFTQGNVQSFREKMTHRKVWVIFRDTWVRWKWSTETGVVWEWQVQERPWLHSWLLEPISMRTSHECVWINHLWRTMHIFRMSVYVCVLKIK